MAESKGTTTRLNSHSKKIAVIEQQQQEHYKLLSGIDKKLSDDFFERNEKMYEYVIVGNGVTSLKQWRAEIDKERAERKAVESDVKAERRKWIFYIVTFSAGVATNIIFNFFK